MVWCRRPSCSCMTATLGEGIFEEAVAILATTNTNDDGLLGHDEFLRLVGQPEEEEMRMSCLRGAFDMYTAE
uniref:EF-hand domain-containing protein n=1 Tax=Oryza brachyantha TaxID=4533 RepID=J3LNC9_ORYBR